jgi:hypothetical protein
MRHPFYNGRKSEHVPSVGSRLAGTVKPSYGKAKLTLETNPLRLTGDARSFGFNPLGPHDLNAKSPYRLTRDIKASVWELASLLRLARRNRKRSIKQAAQMPRLIKN